MNGSGRGAPFHHHQGRDQRKHADQEAPSANDKENQVPAPAERQQAPSLTGLEDATKVGVQGFHVIARSGGPFQLIDF